MIRMESTDMDLYAMLRFFFDLIVSLLRVTARHDAR